MIASKNVNVPAPVVTPPATVSYAFDLSEAEARRFERIIFASAQGTAALGTQTQRTARQIVDALGITEAGVAKR